MNVWECADHGCGSTAVGVGGAIGLRAIGWHFTYGGPILCPRHRPDPVPCDDKYSTLNHGIDCHLCSAEHEADSWQAGIIATVGGFPA